MVRDIRSDDHQLSKPDRRTDESTAKKRLRTDKNSGPVLAVISMAVVQEPKEILVGRSSSNHIRNSSRIVATRNICRCDKKMSCSDAFHIESKTPKQEVSRIEAITMGKIKIDTSD